MRVEGSALAGGAYTDAPPDIPRGTITHGHRPWCVDCKRKYEADQLDDDQRCTRCATAAAMRAEAALRRATDPAAQAVWEKALVEHRRGGGRLRRQSVATLGTSGRQPSFDVDEAMRRYEAGDPVAEIASDVGCTPANIYTHAQKRGIRRPQPQKPVEEPTAAAPVAPPVEQSAHPRAGLQAVLDDLDRTEPDVAAAAASYDDMVERITQPDDHVQAPDLRRDLDSLIEILVDTRARHDRELAAIEDALRRLHDHLPPAPRAAATAPSLPPEVERPRPAAPRRRTPTSRFNIREARRLYLEEEKSCSEIAIALGSTVSTVRKQLKAAGTPMRDDRARGSGGWNKKAADDDSPDLVAAVRRHYVDEQLTIERTAAAVGLSPKGLAALMSRHGIDRRPPANVAGQAPRWRKLDDQQVATICDRYDAGDSTVILARAYGVSTPTITNALRRRGVVLRTPAEARRLALTRQESA